MLKPLPNKEEKGGWQIGDIHPDFPLLYVDYLNADGSVGSWGTKGPYFSLDDPNVIVLDREGRQLQRYLKSKDVVDCILGRSARPVADTETQSGLPKGR